MKSLFAASALALGLLLAAPQAPAQTPAADKQQIVGVYLHAYHRPGRDGYGAHAL